MKNISTALTTDLKETLTLAREIFKDTKRAAKNYINYQKASRPQLIQAHLKIYRDYQDLQTTMEILKEQTIETNLSEAIELSKSVDWVLQDSQEALKSTEDKLKSTENKLNSMQETLKSTDSKLYNTLRMLLQKRNCLSTQCLTLTAQRKQVQYGMNDGKDKQLMLRVIDQNIEHSYQLRNSIDYLILNISV